MFELLEPSPEEQAKMLARRMRGERQLREANEQANRLGTLAAVTQMINNEGAAKSASEAHKQLQSERKPISLGAAGFALPTGQFIESPMYMEEKDQSRRAMLAQTLERLATQRDLANQAETGRNERAQDRNALMQTIAELRNQGAADRRTAAEEKAAEKKQRDFDLDMRRFTEKMDSEGVPEFGAALGSVKGVLNQYKEGKLPGYGRIEGGIPDMFATNEMQRVRTDMQSAANILLASRSGASVTDQEVKRFLREVGSGAGMSETALRKGWANVERYFNSKVGNLASGARKEVLDEYNLRRGTNYNPRTGNGAIGGGAPPPPQQVAPATTTTLSPLSSEQQRRLAELRAKRERGE